MNVLNEDWPVRFAQYERMAKQHNDSDAARYTAAMSDWRENAKVASWNKLPEPPLPPSPAEAWAASWPEPRSFHSPALIYESGKLTTPLEPATFDDGNYAVEVVTITPVQVRIGTAMGGSSPFYWAAAGDTAPDGHRVALIPGVLELVKRVLQSPFGKTEYYERITL